jgi:hypothetical protein
MEHAGETLDFAVPNLTSSKHQGPERLLNIAFIQRSLPE